jgi:hypothetical protein
VANALGGIVGAIPRGVMQGIVIAIVAVIGAVKLWTAAQALLDIALNANPVSLIVIAIAALAAAFYLLWEKSAGFRDGIKLIGVGLIDFGIIVIQANKVIIDSFLSMVGTILHAAADAFGWVPGLGDKLRGASKAFDDFKAGVDGSINGVMDTMRGWRSQLDGTRATADAALGKISGDFQAQQKAADASRVSLDAYSTAIASNGVNSEAARAARGQLITDLTGAGVSAVTADTDVTNYTTAVQQNGATSTQAEAARKQLITDILTAGANAATGRSDLQNYTTAVQQNGAQSTSAQGARAQLIRDLENSGLSAKAAAGLVDGLGGSLARLPKNVSTNVNLSGSGSGGITITASGGPASGSIPGGGNIRFTNLAGGGKITEGTGPTADDVLVYVSKDETVVSAADSRKLAPTFTAMGIPGYAAGGVPSLTAAVGGVDPFGTGRADAGGMNAVTQGIKDALAVARAAMAKAAAVAAGSAGPGGGAPAANAALAKQIMPSWGSGAQWAAWNALEMSEAGWNQFAKNPSSGAYGIPQALPASKMGAAANPPQSNPTAQIRWMVSYIQSVYGDPINADAHENADHWYGSGGMITEPVIGFGSSGQRYHLGEKGPELVSPGGGMTLAGIASRLERLIAVTSAVPAGVGGHMGAAIGGATQAASFRQRYPRGGS